MDLTRKAGLGLALLTVAGLAATTPVQAQTLYSTGVDASGNSLGDGAAELHYTLVSVPAAISPNTSTTDLIVRKDGSNGYPLPPDGPYLGNTTTSAWIGPNNDHQLNGPDGNYDYQTTFILAPGQASNFSLSGLWSTDNEGSSITLNKVATGLSITKAESYTNYTPFTINSGFVDGPNTLDFIVHNDSPNDNPTALRVDGLKGGTVAPEPSSFAVFGFLGLGMAGLMLKARKRSASAA
jgi:hypothetical protein